MDLRLLRYFLAVCDAGTLHAASAVLRVAQPSLSRQIRRLEQDLGFELFERSARGLALTAAGRRFRPVAEDLVGRASQAAATASAISRGKTSDLTVVAAPTTAADIVAPFIVRSGREGVIGNVVETMPEHVYSAVVSGRADFAVGTRIPPSELRAKVVGQAFLWAQMRRDHPLASREIVDIADLVEQPLVVMSRAHGVRQMFDSAAARAGLRFTAALETESPPLAQALAAAGRGICILSDDPRFGLTTLPIDTTTGPLVITLFGVWDEMHYASTQIEQCVDELERFLVETYPPNQG
ncbi:LysR substrate-binding domain-containing protein [Agromyces sp. NPDC058064]|uniref:LysR family transcriptional regulator n=1 Tax=Agromyces sp. NPDC058064 TaxID=3346322 RepID=UPI0036DCAFB5